MHLYNFYTANGNGILPKQIYVINLTRNFMQQNSKSKC